MRFCVMFYPHQSIAIVSTIRKIYGKRSLSLSLSLPPSSFHLSHSRSIYLSISINISLFSLSLSIYIYIYIYIYLFTYVYIKNIGDHPLCYPHFWCCLRLYMLFSHLSHCSCTLSPLPIYTHHPLCIPQQSPSLFWSLCFE